MSSIRPRPIGRTVRYSSNRDGIEGAKVGQEFNFDRLPRKFEDRVAENWSSSPLRTKQISMQCPRWM